MTDLRAQLEVDLAAAERKAWDALARWKFWMFGYWAGKVVTIKRQLGRQREPFFKDLVVAARTVMAQRYGVAIGAGDAYLVWSNMHNAFWRPDQAGYTSQLAQAGRYSRERAIGICAGCRDGYDSKMVPTEIPLRLDAVMCAQPGTLIGKLVLANDDAECRRRDRAMRQEAA